MVTRSRATRKSRARSTLSRKGADQIVARRRLGPEPLDDRSPRHSGIDLPRQRRDVGLGLVGQVEPVAVELRGGVRQRMLVVQPAVELRLLRSQRRDRRDGP